MPKNHFGAELPQEALEEFAKFVSWWKDGEKVEVEIDDEDGILRARDTDPKFVASLEYLGTRGGSSMFYVPGFSDPDTSDVERWVISQKPLPFGYELLAADHVGQYCTLCGAILDDEPRPQDDGSCDMCSGSGSAQYWFEDFLSSEE